MTNSPLITPGVIASGDDSELRLVAMLYVSGELDAECERAFTDRLLEPAVAEILVGVVALLEDGERIRRADRTAGSGKAELVRSQGGAATRSRRPPTPTGRGAFWSGMGLALATVLCVVWWVPKEGHHGTQVASQHQQLAEVWVRQLVPSSQTDRVDSLGMTFPADELLAESLMDASSSTDIAATAADWAPPSWMMTAAALSGLPEQPAGLPGADDIGPSGEVIPGGASDTGDTTERGGTQ